MDYSKESSEYIKSVDGCAHLSAVEIINRLSKLKDLIREYLEALKAYEACGFHDLSTEEKKQKVFELKEKMEEVIR